MLELHEKVISCDMILGLKVMGKTKSKMYQTDPMINCFAISTFNFFSRYHLFKNNY